MWSSSCWGGLMNDFFQNVERLQLPAEQTPTPISSNGTGKKSPAKPKRINGEFLKGPIPLNWLSMASSLPGKALAVALAIWFEAGRRRSLDVTLTTAILARFGVGRKAKYQALQKLERAQLISVVRVPHKNPLVRILDLHDGKPDAQPSLRASPKQSRNRRPPGLMAVSGRDGGEELLGATITRAASAE